MTPPRPELVPLAEVVTEVVRRGDTPTVVFVCTHNSRRSHLAQVAFAAACTRMGIGVTSLSAGTDVTACHPNSVRAIRDGG